MLIWHNLYPVNPFFPSSDGLIELAMHKTNIITYGFESQDYNIQADVQSCSEISVAFGLLSITLSQK